MTGAAAVDWLRFAGLDAIPGVRHAVFGRHRGVSQPPWDSLNVSFAVGDDPANVRANRGIVAASLGFTLAEVASVRQEHGTRTLALRRCDPHAEAELPAADILCTDEAGVLLLMKFADCVPILLAAQDGRAVAIAHAGWRGTLAGVAGLAVRALAEQFAVPPAAVWAGVGAAAGPCCYRVGAEVVEAARSSAAVPAECLLSRADGYYLDLWEAARRQLQAAGVPERQIQMAGVCTVCNSARFFSHRATRGRPSGRFAAAIGLRP